MIEMLQNLFKQTDQFYMEFDPAGGNEDIAKWGLPLGNARLKFVLSLYHHWKKLVHAVEELEQKQRADKLARGKEKLKQKMWMKKDIMEKQENRIELHNIAKKLAFGGVAGGGLAADPAKAG